MTVLKYDLAELTQESYGYIYADPKDTWNAPNVQVSRTWSEDKAELADRWRFEIRHSSSSSRSHGVDCILKTGLMIAQLTDCVDTVRALMNDLPALEAAYQANREAAKAERERIEAERKAREDADTRIGTSQAAHIVATICVDHKHGQKYRTNMTFRRRGGKDLVRLTARTTAGGAVQFKLNRVIVKKAEVIEHVAGYAEVVKEEVTA
jgi:hypothetical protein